MAGTKTNQSVEKVFQIIEIMASSPGPMRLTDIAEAAKIPQSTALRLLKTLMEHGYARRERDTLQYALSMKFSRVGSQIASQISLPKLARPYLSELSTLCRESVCLAVETEMEVVYIDVIDGPDGMLQILQRIGKRASMHCTGIGKLLLLNYDNDTLNDYFQKKGLPRCTPHTICSEDAMRQELSRVAAQGYAIDNEECELGARCIAAGIRDFNGKNIAGISVSGPSFRMTEERISQIRPIVLEKAKELSSLFS